MARRCARGHAETASPPPFHPPGPHALVLAATASRSSKIVTAVGRTERHQFWGDGIKNGFRESLREKAKDGKGKAGDPAASPNVRGCWRVVKTNRCAARSNAPASTWPLPSLPPPGTSGRGAPCLTRYPACPPPLPFHGQETPQAELRDAQRRQSQEVALLAEHQAAGQDKLAHRCAALQVGPFLGPMYALY